MGEVVQTSTPLATPASGLSLARVAQGQSHARSVVQRQQAQLGDGLQSPSSLQPHYHQRHPAIFALLAVSSASQRACFARVLESARLLCGRPSFRARARAVGRCTCRGRWTDRRSGPCCERLPFLWVYRFFLLFFCFPMCFCPGGLLFFAPEPHFLPALGFRFEGLGFKGLGFQCLGV